METVQFDSHDSLFTHNRLIGTTDTIYTNEEKHARRAISTLNKELSYRNLEHGTYILYGDGDERS
jgi:hypothetical protein